jgi:putative ABC transport system permease protein
VNLPLLAFRNTFRNRTRAVLTIGSVAVLVVAFIFLRTVISAYHSTVDNARSDRLVTRNRVSLAVPLPLADFERIKSVAGVTAVTYGDWFGGTYIDSRHFFARFAIDPDTYFTVYKDITINPDALSAFKADRTGCLVGEGLVERYGFKVGDVIHLQGDIYPGDWAFTVRGTFKGVSSFQNGSMFIQWKAIDQSLPDTQRGMVGSYTLLVKDADRSPEIAKAVDALFANSANETLTESEQAFSLGFLTGSSAIVNALDIVSIVLLVIMLLILGNTLAMAVRERTGELAVLRTIGFKPNKLFLLALTEGLWLSLIGGVLGAVIARPVIHGFLKSASSFITGSSANNWTLPALGVAIGIGLLAAAIPAFRASSVNIVNALRRAE